MARGHIVQMSYWSKVTKVWPYLPDMNGESL
jgi:hypothetical protein